MPVGAPETVAELEKRVDRLVVLEAPPDFMAVGEHYVDFAQVEDETVRALLAVLTLAGGRVDRRRHLRQRLAELLTVQSPRQLHHLCLPVPCGQLGRERG